MASSAVVGWTGEERAEMIGREFEAQRERVSTAQQHRTTKSVADRDQPGITDKNLPDPDRG
jgi:hypothetical protein